MDKFLLWDASESKRLDFCGLCGLLARGCGKREKGRAHFWTRPSCLWRRSRSSGLPL